MFHRLLPVMLAGLALSTAARAETQHITGKFQDEHGATNPVAGRVRGTLDTSSGVLTYSLRYHGLSGPVNAIHLHGPADAGQDAGVLAPVPGPYKSRMHGALHLTPEQVKDVQDGKSYFNLHTAAHADGEARAQITTH